MDFMGGCTLIIDAFGNVRYAIYKKIDSAERQKRQYAAIKGPLRNYWRMTNAAESKEEAGKRLIHKGGTFKLMHGVASR